MTEEEINQTPHNWLYSYMPVEFRIPDGYLDTLDFQPRTRVYLIGYCKQCHKSFSEEVRIAGEMKLTQMSFPKVGCDATFPNYSKPINGNFKTVEVERGH